MDDNAAKMHAIRVKAEDEIERILLRHHAMPEVAIDTAALRHQMDLAIAATIVENKIKARGTAATG